MGITRRSAFKGLMAASSLPLFNVGCAGFGESRAQQIAKGAKRLSQGMGNCMTACSLKIEEVK